MVTGLPGVPMIEDDVEGVSGSELFSPSLADFGGRLTVSDGAAFTTFAADCADVAGCC